MKITDLETIALRDPGKADETIVQVHTDEGLTGMGQAESPALVIDAILHCAEGLENLLLGEDPVQVDRLWQKMYAATGLFGRVGVRRDVEVTRAVRETIGPEVELLIDLQNQWREVGQAVETIRTTRRALRCQVWNASLDEVSKGIWRKLESTIERYRSRICWPSISSPLRGICPQSSSG